MPTPGSETQADALWVTHGRELIVLMVVTKLGPEARSPECPSGSRNRLCSCLGKSLWGWDVLPPSGVLPPSWPSWDQATFSQVGWSWAARVRRGTLTAPLCLLQVIESVEAVDKVPCASVVSRASALGDRCLRRRLALWAGCTVGLGNGARPGSGSTEELGLPGPVCLLTKIPGAGGESELTPSSGDAQTDTGTCHWIAKVTHQLTPGVRGRLGRRDGTQREEKGRRKWQRERYRARALRSVVKTYGGQALRGGP